MPDAEVIDTSCHLVERFISCIFLLDKFTKMKIFRIHRFLACNAAQKD